MTQTDCAIFQCVIFQLMLKFGSFTIKLLTVHARRLSQLAVIPTFMSKYFIVPFSTAKTVNFLPLEKYSLRGLAGIVLQNDIGMKNEQLIEL